MNKKSIGKLTLFMSGIIGRMHDNSDYFLNITIEMKSGTKIFKAVVNCEEGKYYFDFQGVKKEILSSDITALIEKELLSYEAARVIYKERGTEIIIYADDKSVKMNHGTPTEEKEKMTSVVQTGREYVVNPALASDLLTEIGIMAKNGKIKNDKIRKYNQIDYFVELMKDIIDELPQDKELLVMDCACGKSYLSFVMNFYLREVLKRKCSFVGIDYSETVIEASKRIAKNLGYNNMQFIKEDLTTYTPEKQPDIVISLHACDIATDMALALGIRAGARAIVSVPCCHKDVLKQYSYEPFHAVTKHGILKARLADTLTDGLRAAYLEGMGYKVSLIEYISPLETPKNIMIRARLRGGSGSMDEYNNLKKIINVIPAIERFTEGKETDYGYDAEGCQNERDF